MDMYAGKLRHRVAIQQRVESQNSTTGDITYTWQNVAGCSSVPASIEPLSAREFIAAQSVQSEIVARIVIRYRTGLDSKMRILYGSTVYNPAGFLADKNTGTEYLTIPVSEGLKDG